MKADPRQVYSFPNSLLCFEELHLHWYVFLCLPGWLWYVSLRLPGWLWATLGFQFIMAIQVKIWTMGSDLGIPKFYSKVKVLADETYASLRLRLEEKQALEWPFQFWDKEDCCRIRQKMEGLNDVVADVYVLPLCSEDEGPLKRRRLEDDAAQSPIEADSAGVVPNPLQIVHGFFSLIDEREEVQLVDFIGSSRITSSMGLTDSLDHQLNSTLMSNDVWKRYLD